MDMYTKNRIFNLPLKITLNRIAFLLEYYRIGNYNCSYPWVVNIEIKEIEDTGVVFSQAWSTIVTRRGKGVYASGTPKSWLNPHLYAYFYCYDEEYPKYSDSILPRQQKVIPEVNVHAEATDIIETSRTVDHIFNSLDDLERRAKIEIKRLIDSRGRVIEEYVLEDLYKNL